ncbi:hypothetical protein M514_10680 [Trichuris suis]|uniref:Uncharacterized protein n=1 Tax=Trichuris suis TaxID=68888 RepID=A0A085MY33_9BILA|nr:hypothetical protein M513_10680 [Trichuris suis]KFD62129.1 hypothetical protein M514_10680 [Trichuris suis]
MDSHLRKTSRSKLSVGDRIDNGDLGVSILCGLPEDWDIVVSSICSRQESEPCCATLKKRLTADASSRWTRLTLQACTFAQVTDRRH